ncbi:TetR/AcrR family transcriptional regulator [Kineosporia sp. J2-2]|uniref:TetR/AcrR family transcriptional regulator n=1 Tax=Kineosporia corallincola TaxID=2835133 RepID=A0ABS5TRV6_9ACTN|nr:TetR/AcrR family transcriptional regulator [Kineosporia corallincola]MBT0773534.1 TetR/AcrR family transcriptional regulator [Kineosporia corallincola]
MAWDTEATRRKLLEAGVRQFAAHGLAGARMDAIGRDAGVNKERVYKYFGDKQQFFAAVLAHELTALLDGIDVAPRGPEAVGAFTAELFDRCRDRPELPRLLAWESLELDRAVALERRRPICADQASCFQTAVPGLDRATAEHLLLTAVTLVTACWSLGRIGESVLGAEPDLELRRAAIIGQMTALTRKGADRA